jgi:serine/threonine protein kinase
VLDDSFAGNARFEIVRRLGAGGMGVVYEARDRETGARTALKTVRKLSAETILRFKSEFRALQDLRHPNLVTLGELFEDRGRWFFTMELLEGTSFLQHVRPGGARESAFSSSSSSSSSSARRDQSTSSIHTARGPSRRERPRARPRTPTPARSTRGDCATRFASSRAASSRCTTRAKCIATSSRATSSCAPTVA